MGSSLVPIMLIVVLLVALVVFLVLNNRPARPSGQRRGRGLDRQRHPSGAVPIRETASTTSTTTPPPAADDLADQPGAAPTMAVPAGSPASVPAEPSAGGSPTPGVSGSVDTGFDPPDGTADSWDDHGTWDTGATSQAARSEQSSRRQEHNDSGGKAGAAWGGDVTAQVPHSGYDEGRDPDATGWTPPPATPPHQLSPYEDDRENATRYFDPVTGEHPLGPPLTAQAGAPAAAVAAPAGSGEGAPVAAVLSLIHI